jgi:hypothetical protein
MIQMGTCYSNWCSPIGNATFLSVAVNTVSCLLLFSLSFVYSDVGRMWEQREQDSNPGDWRKGWFIMLAGQHLDLSKTGTGPVGQGCRVFMPQNAEASEKDKLASRWEVTTYHTSTRLQLITLTQGYSIPHWYICQTRAARGGNLPSDLSPGFLYQ